MESHNGPPLMAVPSGVPVSILAIPSLEPIPASNVPTPALRDTADVPSPPPIQESDRQDLGSVLSLSEYHTPQESPPQSRRTSLVANTPIAGSYFPSSSFAGPASYATSPARSTGTPGERPRPAPLSIPVSTPDEPIFSAYPDTGSGEPQQVRKFEFPLHRPFSLGHPPLRKRRPQQMEQSATLPIPGSKEHGSRRRSRATSFSFSPDEARHPLPVDSQSQASTESEVGHAQVSRSNTNTRRRRMSLAGHEDAAHWQSFASVNTDSVRPISFTNADARYTIQPSSTGYALRPLGPSPVIAPRRSSLTHTAEVNAVILGLTNLDTGEEEAIRVVTSEDMSADHAQRPNSLDFATYVESKTGGNTHTLSTIVARDDQSLHSASISGTDTTTSSTCFFSTPSSSVEHPLSSTHTSISRSTKSGKEGAADDDKETTLSAIRLQRSLEWEAKQKKRRSRLEQRKGVILELVETELTHTAGLKKLIHVYLPTLRRTFVFQESAWLSITRNIEAIHNLHERILSNMINVLKEEGIGYEVGLEPIYETQVDRAARRLVKVLINEVPAFDAVYTYSAGVSSAERVINRIRDKSEFHSFERLCGQSSFSLDPDLSLAQILQGAKPKAQSAMSCPASPARDGPNNRSRLKFEDHLILPIQRVCRYPLLLATLNRTLVPLSPNVEREQPDFSTDSGHTDESDTDIDLVEAHEIMAHVAKQTDDARRIRDEELKSQLVIQRLEPNPNLPVPFLRRLGSCMLIAAFDVLYSHQTSTTLTPASKPKYWATFVYRGFVVFAKVKRPNAYEPKHFFPLETSTIVYVEDGSLPFTVRIAIGDHFFDIGCSCKAEKDLLSETLSAAREEVVMTPFDMPSSISPYATARTRRMSSVLEQEGAYTDFSQSSSKRHTVAAVSPVELDFAPPRVFDDLAYVHSPVASSPTRTTFNFTTPDKRHMSITSQKKPGVWVKLPNSSQRETVDETMADIFSIECAKIRRGHGLNHILFFEDEADRPAADLHRKPSSIGAGSLLRRRKSFIETRQPVSDITFVGEVRGSVIPTRHSRSVTGHRRHGSASGSYSHAHSHSHSYSHHHPPQKRFTIGGDESTESETVRGAASEVTEDALSDFGALPNRAFSSRTMSSTSLSPSLAPALSGFANPGAPAVVSKRKSLSNIRRGFSESAPNDSGAGFTNLFTLTRRKTTTAPTARRNSHSRAKSVPVSPVGLPVTLPEVPSVPVAPQPALKTKRSMSALAPPATRPLPLRMSSIMGNEADDEASPDSARAERPKPWSNIRRSMSFVFDKGSKPWSSGEDAGTPSYSGISRTPSSVAMTSDDSGSREERDVEKDRAVESEKEEKRDVLEMPSGAPKRRRSLRAGGVLGPFARFTPM